MVRIIQKIEHLIIDIRDNSGGNPDYVAYLNKYLFDEPFTQAVEARVMNNPELDDAIARSKKQWLPFYGIGTFKPKDENYDGAIYVLTNGGTFSAAVEFATVLRKYDRAIFIGEETGGNPIIMGGNYLKSSHSLPNTDIVFYTGTLCTIYDDMSLNTGRGIIPDYPVELSLDDIISGNDLPLEKVLSIIKEDK